MSDTNESELAGTKEPLIITPEEAAARLRQRTKPVPDGGKGGKYNISRAEAVSIAAQIGQQVYDEIRKEHAMTMQLLQEDLAKHFADIRKTVVVNILDLQHRTFSYRVRAAFEYDVQCFGRWLAARRERVVLRFGYWVATSCPDWLFPFLAWDSYSDKAPPLEYQRFTPDTKSAIAGAIAAENGDPIAQAFDTDVDDTFNTPEVAGSMELYVGGGTNAPQAEKDAIDTLRGRRE